jgi:hypothetical protein
MSKRIVKRVGLEDLDAETQLNFASRLSALEYFACHILTVAMAYSLQDPGAIDSIHRRIISEITIKDAETISGMQPEIAVLELQYAIRRLVSLQRKMLRMPRRLRP